MEKAQSGYMRPDDVMWFVSQPMGEGVVLTVNKLDDDGNGTEWVTHQFDAKDSDNRYWGHYWATFTLAMEDYAQRVEDLHGRTGRTYEILSKRV